MDLNERARLEKLLGMLGSSFDGERANAARIIASMAEKKKVSIVELIFGSARSTYVPEWATRPEPKARPTARNTKAREILQGLADIASDAEAYEFTLTAWECQFAADVAARYSHDYELSEKQITVATKILAKVEAFQKKQDASR